MNWWYVTPLLVFLLVYGAFARRVMGGVGGKWPFPLGKIQRGAVVTMVALPFALPMLVINWGFVSLVLPLTAIIVSLGDGDQTDLGEWAGAEPDAPFWDKLLGQTDNSKPFNERYQRDFIGLMVSGAVTAFPAAVALVVHWELLAGFSMLFAGLLKAPAYALAYKIPSNVRNLHSGRELGEAFWGAVCGFAGFLGLVLV